MSESYSTDAVRALARRVRDNGKPLNSWEKSALDRSKGQAGSEGAMLERIVNGSPE